MIHEYFVNIFVHGKLFYESASRTHRTICHVQKCQQNTSESMPLLSTKIDNQFPMSIITFSLFLLHLFRCVLFYSRSRHQCHCYQRKSITSFFKKVFFFYFSLIWNKNCSKCNFKTFHDLNLTQPSHPSTWLCRIEISEKKNHCVWVYTKKRKHFTPLLFIIMYSDKKEMNNWVRCIF